MNVFQSHYSIHPNTIALLPAKLPDYASLVIEPGTQIYVRQTPMELIKEYCLSRFVTYEGIRSAVRQKTGFKRKVPIPINPAQNMYFFPTHATDDYECCWISYNHVSQINPSTKSTSILTFKTGNTIQLELSAYTLRKQMKRTMECVHSYLEFKEMVQYS